MILVFSSASAHSIISKKAFNFPSHLEKHNHRSLSDHLVRLRNRNHTASSCLGAAFSEEIVQLTHNKVLLAAGLSAAIGQLSKPFTSVLLYGKDFDFKIFFSAGSFPSSHSSAVVAAATSLGLERGLSDSIFGLTVVYAGLVMYDSQGVRREVGNHSKVLNKLLQEETLINSSDNVGDGNCQVDSQPRNESSPISPPLTDLENLGPLLSKESKTKSNKEYGQKVSSGIDSWMQLKESIGHTEVEVIAGALLGFIVSITLHATM